MKQASKERRVLDASDEQLLKDWSASFSKYGSHPEDIRVEVIRRSILRLAESSKRLERLTLWLIALTLVLLLVALPPAAEVIAAGLHR